MRGHFIVQTTEAEQIGVRFGIGLCLIGILIDYLTLHGGSISLVTPMTEPVSAWRDVVRYMASPMIWRMIAAVVLWNTGSAHRTIVIALTLVPIISTLVSLVSTRSAFTFMGLVLPLAASIGLPIALWLVLGDQPRWWRFALASTIFSMGEAITNGWL